MKNVRPISRFLNAFCTLLSIVIGVVGIYAAIVLVYGSFRHTGLLYATGDVFYIRYPFSHTTFLAGDFTSGYISMMLIALLGYAAYLWQLGLVFRVFSRDKLFTPNGVQRLTAFYLVNFLAPAAVLLFGIFIKTGIQELLMITMLHAVIGVFAFFMASIFSQGLNLQAEQDLTI